MRNTRHAISLLSRSLLFIAAFFVGTSPLGHSHAGPIPSSAPSAASELASPLSADSRHVYEIKVKPFLAAHCIECHDGDDAKANFRIDNLATDFLAGKTGDNWKEIYDNISLGKMPKKKKLAGAEIDEANAVTDWIDQEIRNAQRRAKNSSGRNPMRRLNRSEYVNSLRDLFALDEETVRSIEEDLQPDGTFAGFDRVGTSLYLDSASLHRSNPCTFSESAGASAGVDSCRVQACHLVCHGWKRWG